MQNSKFFIIKKLLDYLPVGVEHLIALLTSQCFQIPLTPRMFNVWDFVVGIIARKAKPNIGWLLLTLSYQHLYNKK